MAYVGGTRTAKNCSAVVTERLSEGTETRCWTTAISSSSSDIFQESVMFLSLSLFAAKGLWENLSQNLFPLTMSVRNLNSLGRHKLALIFDDI